MRTLTETLGEFIRRQKAFVWLVLTRTVRQVAKCHGRLRADLQ